MKTGITALAVFCLSMCLARAAESKGTDEALGFVRQVVKSLIDGDGLVTFAVADEILAIDNGEVISKADFETVWPQLAKHATKKKVTLEQFFRDVDLRMDSPLNNKRLTSNERVMESYKYQEGDLYCDASHVKDGVDNFIGYDKAFIYIIRKVEGKWTLVGIGG